MHDDRDDRLDGWKAIADYLGRDERTVQRWAKRRGLPVHRLPGVKGASVFASRSEVTHWLEQAPQIGVIPSLQSNPAAPRSELRPGSPAQPRRSFGARRGLLALAVVLAVIAVALAGATALRSRALVPDTIALVGNAVVAKANGRLLWQYPLEKPNWAPADATWRTDPDSPVRPVDLDSNGVAEYLALLHLVRTDDGFVQNNLIALSSSGKQLWRYEPATVLTYGDRKFDGPWRIVGWTLTPGPRPTVWVNVIHHIWWPSFVVSIDPDGKAAVRFVQPGHIYSLAQLDREGRSYVTAAGISNDYHAATLAVLEIDRGSGTPPTFDAAYQCSDCLAGEPLRYLVFPRSELNVALRKPYNRVYDVSMHEKAMDVSVEEGTDPKFRAVYRLSTGFIPETFAFSDSYWEAHRRLETNGTLDHGADTCPSRRAGATVRIWERGRGWTEKVVQFSEGAHRH